MTTVRVDIPAKTVTIPYNDPTAGADIDRAIEDAGYEVARPGNPAQDRRTA